jgi:predicted PurR-regulated permease PerM
MSPRWQRRALITVGLVLLAAGALWFASRIPRTLAVFLVAAFIAFGVEPVVAFGCAAGCRAPRRSPSSSRA